MGGKYLGVPWVEVASAVTYLPRFVPEPDAALREAQEQIQTIERQVRMYGKTHRVPRREAWYGDRPYAFSGHVFPAQEPPPLVVSLRIAAEAFLAPHGWSCNLGCMVNVYHDGADSVGWHSDDDHGADQPVVIVSVSLGAPRKMRFRRKGPQVAAMASAVVPNAFGVVLDHGSALIMGEGVQEEFEHCIPKTSRPSGPRINLTYRGTLDSRH